MKIQTWIASGLMVSGLVLAGQADEKILAQVEIRGLDRAAEDVARLTETAGKPMPGEALLAMVGGALGTTPELSGLDASGVFRLIVMESEGFPEAPPAMTLIAPVAGDGQAYLEVLGKSMAAGDQVDGVYSFAQAPGAPPAMGPPVLHVSLIEGHAVIGMEPEGVRQVRGMATSEASPIGSAIPGTVAARVDVTSLLSIFEPFLDEKMEEMEEMMEAVEQYEPEEGDPPAVPEVDVAKVLNAEVDLLMRMLKQLDQAGLGLGLQGDSLQVHSLLRPKAESEFAAALTAAHPPIDAVRTSLPSNALYAQAMFLPGLDMMIAPYIDFMGELYAGMGPEMEKMAEPIMSMMKGFEGLYPGDFAIGIVPGEGDEWPALVEVATVSDPDRMMEIAEEMIAVQSGMMDTATMGYSYSMTSDVTRAHRGVDITSFTVSMEFDEEVTDNLPPGFDAFLSNLRYDLAFVDGLLVYTVGRSNAMEQAIDRLKDGGGVAVTQGAAFRSRFPARSGEPLDAFTLHVFDAARTVIGLMPEELTESAPTIPSGSGSITGYSRVRDGDLLGTVAIGLADIGAVGELIEDAMPKPGGMMGGGPGNCMQNLKQLALLCYIHEAEAGSIPATLTELGDQLGGPTPLGPPALLVCPQATDPSVPSYRLVASGKLGDIKNPATTPLIEETEAHHNGKRYVAFADGHVELVD